MLEKCYEGNEQDDMIESDCNGKRVIIRVFRTVPSKGMTFGLRAKEGEWFSHEKSWVKELSRQSKLQVKNPKVRTNLVYMRSIKGQWNL